MMKPMGKYPRRIWPHRALCALLAAVLVCGMAPLALAQSGQAVSIDAAPEKETYFGSAILHGGRLVLGAHDGLFVYKPGEEVIQPLLAGDREALVEAGLSRTNAMFGDDKRIFAVDVEEDGLSLQPVAVTEDSAKAEGKPMKLPWGGAQERAVRDGGYPRPQSIVLDGDHAHMLFRVWGPKGADSFILTYELKDGAEPRLREATHAVALTAYKEGQLLVLLMDEENSWDEVKQQQKPADLAVFNLADDNMQPLGSTETPYRHNTSLLYEAQTDTIYMTGNAELLRKVGNGAFEPCAYLDAAHGTTLLGGQLFLLETGKVLVVSGQGVSIRTTDPTQLPKVRLGIYGYLDDAAKKAIREMGGVSVRFVDGKHFPNAQALGQALVSGEDSIDLFLLDGEYMDLSSLYKKGYCLDLSGSQVLTDYAAQVYPTLREAGELDGKLMMVPVEMSAYMFGYHPKVFKAMELEPPKTFFELLDLIELWNDGKAEEHADFTPLNSTDLRSALVRIALQMYADAAQQRGQEFSFSDPLLMRMLERLENLRYEKLGLKVDWESPNAEREAEQIYNKVSMVSEHFDLSMWSIKYMQDAIKYPSMVTSERSGVQMPLPLTADQDIAPNVAVRARMYAVSAASKHPEEAVRFLELYVKHMSDQQKVPMMPGMNEAIPNPNYERNMTSLEDHIKTLEKAVAKAEGAEKTELEANLKRYKESVEEERERQRFHVTEEAVKLYRELLERHYVTTYDSLRVVMNSEDMQKLMSRYMEKQVPLQQFLQEADGKLRLMRLENE